MCQTLGLPFSLPTNILILLATPTVCPSNRLLEVATLTSFKQTVGGGHPHVLQTDCWRWPLPQCVLQTLNRLLEATTPIMCPSNSLLEMATPTVCPSNRLLGMATPTVCPSYRLLGMATPTTTSGTRPRPLVGHEHGNWWDTDMDTGGS